MDSGARKWLMWLATTTVPLNLPEAAWNMKLDVYENLLAEFPAVCFTKDTLAGAAERYRYFPSFAELAEYLRPIRARHYERTRKLPAPEKVHVITDEERQRRLSKLQGMTKRLRRMP